MGCGVDIVCKIIFFTIHTIPPYHANDHNWHNTNEIVSLVEFICNLCLIFVIIAWYCQMVKTITHVSFKKIYFLSLTNWKFHVTFSLTMSERPSIYCKFKTDCPQI